MIYVFWISLFAIFFAYFGYPITLWLISFFRIRRINKSEYLPDISLIITVHNEEKRIREKLENSLALVYPRDKLQTIIASDASTDRTNSIVAEYTGKGIQLVDVTDHKGKENAQKRALEHASGEIIVFTDVATILDTDGLNQIVYNFADPTVGCVSSEDRLLDQKGEATGEGLYIKYEMWLRQLESTVNSLVGLSGSFFAARKEVCRNLAENLPSDFATLLNSIKMGYRGISDRETIGYYRDSSDENQEFNRKVRTVIRGITAFFNNLDYLNFFKYGFFSYQYFCHKLLRWLVPLFLITLFISNFYLIFQNHFFLFFFFLQLAIIFLSLIGMRSPKTTVNVFVRVPKYFTLVNFSILMAWLKWLRGERMNVWQPTRRY